jgi:hypothetical protein
MRYIKTYEEKNSCVGLKKGDIVVFTGDSHEIIKGERYIIHQIFYFTGSQLIDRDEVGETEMRSYVSNSSDSRESIYYFVLTDMNGKKIRDTLSGNSIIFKIDLFLPEIEWEVNKYNL